MRRPRTPLARLTSDMLNQCTSSHVAMRPSGHNLKAEQTALPLVTHGTNETIENRATATATTRLRLLILSDGFSPSIRCVPILILGMP